MFAPPLVCPQADIRTELFTFIILQSQAAGNGSGNGGAFAKKASSSATPGGMEGLAMGGGEASTRFVRWMRCRAGSWRFERGRGETTDGDGR